MCEEDGEERCFQHKHVAWQQVLVKAPVPSPQQCWPHEKSVLESLVGTDRPLHPPDDFVLHLLQATSCHRAKPLHYLVLFKDGHCHLKAFPRVPRQIFCSHFPIIKVHLGCTGAPDPHLLWRAARVSTCTSIHALLSIGRGAI